MFCVECSVVWHRDLDTDGMSKNDWKYLRCGYGEGWNMLNGQKKIRNAVVLERV